MKIKVISDGTSRGTQIYNRDTGELMNHKVISIDIHIDSSGAYATLKIVDFELEIETETR